MKGSKFSALWSILLGGLLPLIFFLTCKSLMPDWKGVHEPLHSVFEALGLFAGLFLAILLLLQQDQKKDGSHYIWILSALIGMGILDGFHASVRPGNSFVWLHSVAVLAGGFLFSMVWMPLRATQSQMARRLAGLVAAAAIALGLFSLVFPEALPLLIVEGNFTFAASTINVLGGILFVVAGIFFLVRYWTNREAEEILFAFFCFLNASAALLFPFGHAWGIGWWLWHLLRLVAYLILLGYVFFIFGGIELKRKMAEELRVASLYTRSLIEASLDPLVTISSDGKITDVNKTTEQVTGVSRERLIGSDFADYFTEPDKARAGYKQVFSQGTVKDYPLTIRHSSGRTTDVLYNASVYKNEAGEVQGVFAAARDITERNQAEESIRKLSHQNKLILDSLGEGVYGVDVSGKATFVNPATAAMTGYTIEELVGRAMHEILHHTKPDGTPYPPEECPIYAAFKDGAEHRVMDEVFWRKDGTSFPVEYVGTSIQEQDKSIGAVVIFKDITERKRIDEELKKYREQLEEMVKQRTGALTDVLSKVKDTVDVLTASSSEIMAATTQVASSTAENATAISETTTTVEETRQAAQLSSQKAKNVSDSAQRVAQVSQTGQKAVEETTTGMRHIRDQMESIAQTIIRLSEQGQSIGGIIASVTDIADQSNLLAVNAAIEAARAGEQGKAFAVVAQEIKSLAEQSKQATIQVRNILGNLQKSTSTAVMATEQGSKAVETAVKQSAQAGEAIRLLAESSQEAVQAATQIVASSQQQVVGMDQIGVAMESINQAGAQNAASVRQAETAAKNLHELGQKLKGLVEQFKV